MQDWYSVEGIGTTPDLHKAFFVWNNLWKVDYKTRKRDGEVSLPNSQAVPLIIPDMLHLDLGQPDGFPNGRNFSDSVVDRVVAVVLLDISTPGQCNGAPCTVDTLVKPNFKSPHYFDRIGLSLRPLLS